MRPLRLLTVCTHNRTRSVLMGALMTLHLRTWHVNGSVRAAGFAEPGLPPTAETIRLLKERRVDVRGHLSRRIDEADVSRADLILTAERMHVVEIAGRWPGVFHKTLTLPEIVGLATRIDATSFPDIEHWLGAMAHARHARTDYLEADDVGEIDDPTGGSPAAWRSCAAQVDDLTSRLTCMLASARVVSP